ncbi:hypothetical protein HX109_02270 [Galbibacter sp. BG1]|uniref:hypothetical protein n=1 Tax=Galbibacter sp. BG1 TaxID=1170699 RepID=UPI0015BD8D4B|nr:hypothetical protein [Galbibacter sp. BG1]QLE00440.1 hypothetical protein HX109_02270 [Galbibacter sp. BG1]
MSSKEEKKLDDFIRKSIQEAGLEKPNPLMKQQVMQMVKKQSQTNRIKALVPVKTKIILAAIVVFCILGIFFAPENQLSTPLFTKISNYLQQIDLEVPKTFMYGILALGAFIILQIPILKKHIDNNY